MRNKKGFTLAEVLITLAVIGVVAALTIPSLISSTGDKQAKTSIKKSLSVLNQALTMSVAQDGIDAGSNASGTSFDLRDLFQGQMSTIADGGTTDADFTTSDGFIYTFSQTGACTSDATTTDCIVEVDINGDRGSEEAGTTSNYQDLYYFVILKEQVIPANTDVTWTAFGRDDSDPVTGGATIDNVAVEALIN